MRKIKFTNNTTSNKIAEMSLTVVVSAVIALVVLIVLIYIFMNGSQNTSKTFASCSINGGTCEFASCPADKGSIVIEGSKCENSNPCCSRTNWLG